MRYIDELRSIPDDGLQDAVDRLARLNEAESLENLADGLTERHDPDETFTVRQLVRALYGAAESARRDGPPSEYDPARP